MFLIFMRPHSFSSCANNSLVRSLPRDSGQPGLRATGEMLAQWDLPLLEGAPDSPTQAASRASSSRALVSHVKASEIKRAAPKSINFSFPLIYL